MSSSNSSDQDTIYSDQDCKRQYALELVEVITKDFSRVALHFAWPIFWINYLITNLSWIVLLQTAIWRKIWIWALNRYSHRPINIDMMASVIIKRAIIFAVEFFKIIQKDDIMMNIDESSISISTRPSRSWSIKGETSELKSINATESISLISWISSTGWHFNHIQNNSINSQLFGVF